MKGLMPFLAFIVLILGCESLEKTPGYGRIKIDVFDSPPPSGVEHIYLTISEVNVHKSGEDWMTLAEPNATYDFLELINGATGVLVDDILETGHYTQLRLVVAETNEVVIDGETHSLRVPSGEQTGVKLNLDFTVEEDELIEIYVDFDASRSITWTSKNYLLHPTFKAFKKVISGTVSGMAKDSAGVGIANALVEATGSSDTIATLTDSTGAYKLVVLNGTYDIASSADGFAKADTAYAGIELQAEAHLTGYDFVLGQ